MRIMLVTGGAGFIGSNFVKYFLRRNKDFIIVNIDKLNNPYSYNNIKEIENNPRHHFIKGDICNYELVNYVLRKYRPQFIVNFVDESNINRGCYQHPSFVESNILGTFTLLEGARYIWNKRDLYSKRFIQISTSEVYGSIEANSDDYFLEESGLMPCSVYSASKAGADLMVKSFSNAYEIPTIITRSCNTYGPNQPKGDFIPSYILGTLDNKPFDSKVDSENLREWIYVLDHSIAVIRALFYGKPGETYNIGTGEEASQIDIAKKILKISGKLDNLHQYSQEKPKRYKRCALNSYKARTNLGWAHKFTLDDGLKDTFLWYRQNKDLFKS